MGQELRTVELTNLEIASAYVAARDLNGDRNADGTVKRYKGLTTDLIYWAADLARALEPHKMVIDETENTTRLQELQKINVEDRSAGSEELQIARMNAAVQRGIATLMKTKKEVTGPTIKIEALRAGENSIPPSIIAGLHPFLIREA